MRSIESTPPFQGLIVRPETMSAKDFLAWGVDDMVYVKPVTVDGRSACAIHAANGRRLDVAPGRDAAFAAIRQHELVAVSVH